MKRLIAAVLFATTLPACVNLGEVRETQDNLNACVGAYQQLGQIAQALMLQAQQAKEPAECKGV
jgi:hypothetical protein